MLKDMTRRERTAVECHEILFYTDRDGGYGFPCDKNGNISNDLTEAAKENYRYCIAHPEEFPYYYNEHHVYKKYGIKNATGVCSCGNRIELFDQYLGACECPHCGKWYSMAGDELLPPEQWNNENEMDYNY